MSEPPPAPEPRPASDPERCPACRAPRPLQRGGGVVTPVLTALLAFFVGGLVVLFTTGKNPMTTYKAIFNGTGLNWFFPWVRPARSGSRRPQPPADADQSRVLVFTGLAVAFAFRCGLFNIGGQGQYIVGTDHRSPDRSGSIPDLPHAPPRCGRRRRDFAGALWAESPAS